MPNMKECLKPHALLHLVTGAGIGLVVSSLVTELSGQTGLYVGIGLIVVALIAEFAVNK